MERREINIIDYFFLLYQAKWYIIGSFIIVCVFAGAFSYTLPVYYQSSATILPPSDTDQGLGLSQAVSMIPVSINLGSAGTPSDIYLGILESQTMAQSMIDEFDLMNVYGTKYFDTTVLALDGRTDFSINRHGLISVKVQDTDPERAAAMVNFYIAMLDSVNRRISQESSAENVRFLEGQIERNRIALEQAEGQLKEFQERTNVMSPYHQQRIALSMTAELEADIMGLESQLKDLMARSLTPSNSMVQDIERSIDVRQEQLDEMQFGRRDEERTTFVPLREVPDLMVEYTRLSRRAEILGQLEEVLIQQYEEQNIQRTNNSSTVNVLDYGRVPGKKFRPRRTLIVIVAGTMSLFFSILIVIIIGFINQLTEIDQKNREKVAKLARFLRIQA